MAINFSITHDPSALVVPKHSSHPFFMYMLLNCPISVKLVGPLWRAFPFYIENDGSVQVYFVLVRHEMKFCN